MFPSPDTCRDEDRVGAVERGHRALLFQKMINHLAKKTESQENMQICRLDVRTIMPKTATKIFFSKNCQKITILSESLLYTKNH